MLHVKGSNQWNSSSYCIPIRYQDVCTQIRRLTYWRLTYWIIGTAAGILYVFEDVSEPSLRHYLHYLNSWRLRNAAKNGIRYKASWKLQWVLIILRTPNKFVMRNLNRLLHVSTQVRRYTYWIRIKGVWQNIFKVTQKLHIRCVGVLVKTVLWYYELVRCDISHLVISW